MVKHYVDEVPPSGGRIYLIEDVGSGNSSITDVTDYVQAGTSFGAADVQDTCLLECNHSKTGTIHALTTDNTLSVNIKFTATAAWAAGDTLTFNGTAMTCKLKNGDSLPGGAWESGAVVTCYKNSNTLYFDLPNGVASSNTSVDIGGSSSKKLYCNKQGSVVTLTVELTNIAFSAGKVTIGSAVIPSDYRPSRRYISGMLRPVNTADSAITNTTFLVFEINASGDIYAFASDALATGWVVQGTFTFVQ